MTVQALATVIDRTERTTAPEVPYQIKFSTGTVKPLDLPTFPYVHTELHFDCIVYAAVVMARSLEQAVLSIKDLWPDAIPREAKEGLNALPTTVQSAASTQYGATKIAKKLPWYRRSLW